MTSKRDAGKWRAAGRRGGRAVKRLVYRLHRASSGAKFWALRRFTRSGLLVLAAVLFTAAVGMDTNLTVAYQGLAFVVCLLAVSLTRALAGRGRFVVRRRLPRYGTVGAPMPYQLEITNNTRRVQRSLLLLEDWPDPRPALAQFLTVAEPGEEQRNAFDRLWGYYRWRWLVERNIPARIVPAQVPDVGPGETVEVAHQLTPKRRGRLRLDGVTVAWPEPLGLCLGLARVPEGDSVLVLPRRYPLPNFSLPGSLRYQHGGVALASQVGHSEEFIALREYRAGDPLRHIHWRTWAKVGVPIVREYHDEFFSRYALILDTFAGDVSEEVFEEAVAVAASFACTIPDEDSLLDLMFVGPQAYCFTAGRGLAYPEHMLEVLAAVQPCCEQPFSALEQLILQHLGEISGCVCVFLAWDDARAHLVELLKLAGLPVLLLQVVPAGSLTEEAAAARDRHRGGGQGERDGDREGDGGPAEVRLLEVGKVQETLLRL